MGHRTRATRAARIYRVVVVGGSSALFVSAFLPWYTINGFTYTFLDVDSWKALPVAELVVTTCAVLASMVLLRRIKRIGLVVGTSGILLNVVGAVVAARLADVHNSDQYFRLWAIMTVRPALGGIIALSTSLVLVVGALSQWSVRTTRRDVPTESDVELSHFEGSAGRRVRVPVSLVPEEGEPEGGRFGLPHLDDVLAPPLPRRP